jgi:prophage regulatory protein
MKKKTSPLPPAPERQSDDPQTRDIQLWRRARVQEDTGLPTSSLYRLIQLGEFPRPIKLTQKTSAWRSDEVRAWIDARIRAREEGSA